MTVTTETNLALFIGNDIADEFDYPFRVLSSEHLLVEQLDATTGALTKTYTAGEYTVSGIGADAGSITLLAGPLSSTHHLRVTRTVPYTQELDIVNQGGFYPQTVEDQLDLTVMGLQQLGEMIERTMLFPPGETGSVLASAEDRAGRFLVFDAGGVPTTTAGSGSDGSLRVDLAGSGGASLVGYIAPGLGAVATTVAAALGRVLHQDDFGSYAQAEAAAGNSKPLWCYPQVNTGLGGADTQIGLRMGHLVVGGPGDALNDVDAFVALLAQEVYLDVDQEMRIGSFALRYGRQTTNDEATLGWDGRVLSATLVVDASNTKYLRGNLNPFTAELIYDKPAVPYAAKNSYAISTYMAVSSDVTLENVDLLVIKAPVGGEVPGSGNGAIEDINGIVIQNLAGTIAPSGNIAAIRLEGAADSGRIWWGNSNWITADVSGKLEISANGQAIVLKNVVTRAPSGGAIAGELLLNIGGTSRWFPYIN